MMRQTQMERSSLIGEGVLQSERLREIEAEINRLLPPTHYARVKIKRKLSTTAIALASLVVFAIGASAAYSLGAADYRVRHHCVLVNDQWLTIDPDADGWFWTTSLKN